MNIHLSNDEKVINRTMSLFEEFSPDNNLWVITNRATSREFKTVKKEYHKYLLARDEFLKDITGAISKILASRDEEIKIFIHLLNPRKISIAKKILKKTKGKKVKVYWIIWGLDLYNKLLAPVGFKMYAHNPTPPFYRFYKAFFAKLEAMSTVSFVKKHVDCIVTDTTEIDYTYLIKYYPQLSGKEWKNFFYYPIDVILGDLYNMPLPDIASKNIIMVGNSASATNNHIYVLSKLKEFNLNNREVVVPLSYSGTPSYVKEVTEYGKKHIPNFRPFTKFIPLADYNRLQYRTGIALFGNFRQEAIGNIMVALYMGAKVFLSKRNPVYEWASQHNLKVYDLDEIRQEDFDLPLSYGMASANRSILRELYSKEKLLQLIGEL